MKNIITFVAFLLSLGLLSATAVKPLEPARSLLEHPGGVIEVPGFYVAADQEIIFRSSVEIRTYGELVIDGVIRTVSPEDPSHGPSNITLSSLSGIVIRGDVICHDGADGRESGEAGGDGASLEVRAPITVSAVRLRAGNGGHGASGGGKGGDGGSMQAYTQYVGPYRASESNVLSYVNAGNAGDGGKGGGNGGNGGSAAATSFREALWMVPFREDAWLTPDEIKKLEQGEANSKDRVLRKFEPRPVRGVSRD